jgi:hypothetical protein
MNPTNRELIPYVFAVLGMFLLQILVSVIF